MTEPTTPQVPGKGPKNAPSNGVTQREVPSAEGAAASTELVPLLTSFRSHHPKDRVETINRAFHTAAGAHHT